MSGIPMSREQEVRTSYGSVERDTGCMKEKKGWWLFTSQQKGLSKSSWKPAALLTSTLTLSILIPWILILVLEFLLLRSNRDDGIIFAPEISSLPLSKTFLFLYFPTVLSVIYSLFWNWIDLQIKRLEPWYQLSREGKDGEGVEGKDSVLLAYPFDFLPFVPVKAFKNRHWSVFWASTAVMLVTWGLVPIQAAIFATRNITRVSSTPISVSTSFMPPNQQELVLTPRYGQSVYGIVLLNETLPPYMSWNYTLAPFSTQDDHSAQISSGTWTAPTTLYSLDVSCEVGQNNDTEAPQSFVNSKGCTFPMGLSGNTTIGTSSGDTDFWKTKTYSAMYVGFWNDLGFADYSLDDSCPTSQNHTFFASFVQNKKNESDPPNRVKALFCQPFYYSQAVNATVDIASKTPISFVPQGPKTALTSEIYNTTLFESQLNSGALKREVRGALPTREFPKYLDRLSSTELSTVSGGAMIQPMAALAALSANSSMDSNLDPESLARSYETAYRLLFVRSMVDVLQDSGFSYTTQKLVDGTHEVKTQAVVLVPVFTIISQVVLGLISLCAIALLYLAAKREMKLGSEPSTIASVMALVADNPALLSEFKDMDCSTEEEIASAIGKRRFRLQHGGTGTNLVEVTSNPSLSPLPTSRTNSSKEIENPIRPREFRLFVASAFTTTLLLLTTTLLILFFKSQPNGVPLPSQNRIVQQLIENYVPTAIATLIEPAWVLINRLFCLLQPFEELRRGKALPKRSIELDYSSLPPQLVAFKALRSKHFVLAAVCSMALLANLLAIAFSGLFNQDTASVTTDSMFHLPYEAKFVAINGSVGPAAQSSFGLMNSSGAYQGGQGDDQFLVAESNYTRRTLLPAWTDETMFYLPFTIPSATDNDGTTYSAKTTAFGANLDCAPLTYGNNYTANLFTADDRTFANVSLTMKGEETTGIRCASQQELRVGPINGEFDGSGYQCQSGKTAAELIVFLDAQSNATSEEANTCKSAVSMGWIRNPDGTCDTIKNRTLDATNSFFVVCRPKMVLGDANILVNSKGELQRPAQVNVSTNISSSQLQQYFINDASNLLDQSNTFLFVTGGERPWHNDSFDSDFMNHFLIRDTNSSRLVDPNLPPPTWKDVQEPLARVHRRLFATWLGVYKDRLLVPQELASTASILGLTIRPTERLFLSTAMFAIAEAILCIYLVVSIFVYLRRPKRYLPRLPTSIASLIALFAASAAVEDFRGMSQLAKNKRVRYLNDSGNRYAYGSFVGSDGKVHVGIEKEPFVTVQRRKGRFGVRADV